MAVTKHQREILFEICRTARRTAPSDPYVEVPWQRTPRTVAHLADHGAIRVRHERGSKGGLLRYVTVTASGWQLFNKWCPRHSQDIPPMTPKMRRMTAIDVLLGRYSTTNDEFWGGERLLTVADRISKEIRELASMGRADRWRNTVNAWADQIDWAAHSQEIAPCDRPRVMFHRFWQGSVYAYSAAQR